MVCSDTCSASGDGNCSSGEFSSPKSRMATRIAVGHKVLNRAIWAMVTLCEKRDPCTAEHQIRVAQLAYAVGKEMGLGEQQNEGMCVMGLVHDIGKVTLPGEILNKPGRLSAEEFNLVKLHPTVGHEVLEKLEFPWPVAQVVLCHHERLDGSGYPVGLRGDDIILEARILAVADVFDSMISHRPYRPAYSPEEALEEIVKYRGVLYDRDVVDCFRRISGKCRLDRI